MLHWIVDAIVRRDHAAAITWSDGVTAAIDLSPVIAKDRLGLVWPDRVDFSADGLRFKAFPEEAEAEFRMVGVGS